MFGWNWPCGIGVDLVVIWSKLLMTDEARWTLTDLNSLITSCSVHFGSISSLQHWRQYVGREAQSITCLNADTCLTAVPVIKSLILVRTHTFMEIDLKSFLRPFSSLPLIHRNIVESYKWKYVHEELFNCLVKLAQEKSVVSWTDETLSIKPNKNIGHYN